MALHNIDMDALFRRLADRRIEEAMEEGKFSNLAGEGKPLDLEQPPADENARALWWALRIMKNADFTPHEVTWRKQIDGLKEKLNSLTDESQLPPLVDQINQLVHKINTLGTNAISLPAAPLDLETERSKFRVRRGTP